MKTMCFSLLVHFHLVLLFTDHGSLHIKKDVGEEVVDGWLLYSDMLFRDSYRYNVIDLPFEI